MTPLEKEIRGIIETEGPIPVADYMRLCLAHPRHGYYMTRDPLGARGDFTTAPEVSQMFGELIGAWAATVWRQMGSPPRVHLVELGPGRGTLMADALRAAQALPEFHRAIAVHLVEVSPVLGALQEKTLADAGISIAWHHVIEEIPDGPTIAIANEFVDALPISQFIKDRDGWHARMVGIVDDQLAFVVAPDAMLGHVTETDSIPFGSILERRHDPPISLLAQRLAQEVEKRCQRRLELGEIEIFGAGEELRRVSPADPDAGPLNLKDREVILVDDVLYTGRTVKSALSIIFRSGRPQSVRLAVLIDRGHREVPVRPNYVGKNIPTAENERVRVKLRGLDQENRDHAVLYSIDHAVGQTAPRPAREGTAASR